MENTAQQDASKLSLKPSHRRWRGAKDERDVGTNLPRPPQGLPNPSEPFPISARWAVTFRSALRRGAGSVPASTPCPRQAAAGAARDARFELPPIVARSAYRACNANPHARGAPDEPSRSDGSQSVTLPALRVSPPVPSRMRSTDARQRGACETQICCGPNPVFRLCPGKTLP